MDIEMFKFVVLQGGFCVLAFAAGWLAKSERGERQAAQAQLFEMGKRSVEADFTIAKSVDGLTNAMQQFLGTVRDLLNQRKP